MAKINPALILSEALRSGYQSPITTPKPTPAPVQTSKQEQPTSKPTFNEVAARQLLGQMAGALVASRSRDNWNNWGTLCVNNDAWLLYAVYKEVRDLHAEPNIKNNNRVLTQGAIHQGYTTQYTNKFNTAESRAWAKIANDVTKPVDELLNGYASRSDHFLVGQNIPRNIADISRLLGMYCNVPIHLEFYKDLTLKTLSILPPFLWKINSDSSFRWKEGQPAYIQFDAGNTTVEKKYLPENIVWASANHDPDQRYGFPFVYNLATSSNTLKALTEGLKDARVAGSPHFVVGAEGPDGRGFNLEEWFKLWNELPEQQLAMGAKAGALSNMFNHVFNGKVNAEILSAGTGFFNDFGDADLLTQTIALGYGLQAALSKGAEKANRATLEFLLRLQKDTQREWATHLGRVAIFEIHDRALYMAKVDTTQVSRDLTWEEERTPEETAAIAGFAKESWLDGLIAEETAHEKTCAYIGVKPEVDRQRKQKEKADGVKPPQENRSALRISGASKLPGSDINQQVLDQLHQLDSNLSN